MLPISYKLLILFHAKLRGWSSWLEYLNPDMVDWLACYLLGLWLFCVTSSYSGIYWSSFQTRILSYSPFKINLFECCGMNFGVSLPKTKSTLFHHHQMTNCYAYLVTNKTILRHHYDHEGSCVWKKDRQHSRLFLSLTLNTNAHVRRTKTWGTRVSDARSTLIHRGSLRLLCQKSRF